MIYERTEVNRLSTRNPGIEMNQRSAPPPLRVVDFTRYMPGPLASRVLVDLGADVIKIENPQTGDANRGFGPFIHGEGIFHVALNAGTRSLAIDRRSPHWTPVVHAAAKWADVVLVGGLPEGLAKLGVDFETLLAVNPRLVHCVITGYGERGPLRALPAHGLNPDAFAGIVPLDWSNGQPEPHASYQSAGAPLAGVFAALGILAAVRRRDQTGEAQRVHASLYGAALWWNWRHVTTRANLGHDWWRYRDFGSRYATYATADGKVILVCPLEKAYWQTFCDLLELPDDWKERGRWEVSGMDHGTEYDGEGPAIAEKMKRHPAQYWIDAFTAKNIPFAPILSVEEVLQSDHLAANGLMRSIEVNGETASIPSLPVSIGTAEVARPRTPSLGGDTQAVLSDFGLPELADALE